MVLVSLQGESIPVGDADTGMTMWRGGQGNILSKETIAQPLIDGMHLAAKQGTGGTGGTAFTGGDRTGSGEIELPPPASSTRSFGEVSRMRRSALDFIGGTLCHPHQGRPAFVS